MKNLTPHATIALAIIAAVGLFSTAVFFSVSGRYFFKTNHKSDISVTGSASIEFTSDLVVWKGTFQKQHLDLKEALDKVFLMSAAVLNLTLTVSLGFSSV